MLKLFNRLEKTRNFVLLLFAVLMVASLVFFYAPTRDNISANPLQSTEAAATVSGETITVGDIARQREVYSQFSQGRPFPAKMIVNGMIGDKISRVEADKLGLTASDAEVAAAIREQFKPEDGKPFDQKRYEQSIIERYGSVKAFEESVRDDISARKLQALITSGVSVSEEEVLKEYQQKNSKFDLNYVTVNTQDVAKGITPSEEELRAYYDQNKQSFHIDVPQKKIKYVFINTAKIGEKLNISDADLRAEYEALPIDKKKAGVNGQEIVFKVAKPELEGQAYQKANDLVTRLRQDGTVSEEEFAEAAKGQSENTGTAMNGGKIPGIVRENPSNKEDPYQQLLAMKPGEITEPINYKGRYFVLRRGEDVPKPFEAAKKEIEVSLRNRRAYGAAAELAQKASESLKQTKDPQKTAQEFAAQANMSVADMVRETGYVKPGDTVDKIGNSPQFEEGIAPLENPQDVGEKTPIPDGFAIPMLIDQKGPRDSEFDEVKAQVTELVKLEKARAQVEEIAKQIAGAPNAGALVAAATSRGLKSQESKSFILGSPLGEGPSASTNEELENAIFAMKAGEVTKTP
ncbi:MAG TPA: SurA N-terminal domain-containing protein, partial [Pyrinomonadaceae bacterium]|nr:SurA N-terminal domain-containing protein [Pyrinomonadaceae bacterium]